MQNGTRLLCRRSVKDMLVESVISCYVNLISSDDLMTSSFRINPFHFLVLVKVNLGLD